VEQIIPAVERELLLAELTSEHFIRPTNFLENEIYIINGNDCPHVMTEIGRLRELSFRAGGGGTGKSSDVDRFDMGRYAYKQLVVWNPADQQIVGGYRFAVCRENRDADGIYHLSTSEIVDYTEQLKRDFFPYTIELGRSFVQPLYQPSSGDRRNIFSLDNLWDGLGAITVLYPEMEYFFGKITMYTTYNAEARDHLLRFMHHYFPDPDKMVIFPTPLKIKHACTEFLEEIKDLPYEKGYVVLNRIVRSLGENIPPLFNSYMNLSPTMRTFGTAVNPHFGGVEETGIMVTIADIYPAKKDRHTQTYLDYLAAKK
jgi:Acetyltransferase (GNAT) domain